VNIVVRTHVKNQQRLDLLNRTLQSILDKDIDRLGLVHVLDDNSPMREEVRQSAITHNALYRHAENSPGSTKNGLGESLALGDMDKPILCLCDDIVFGKGSLDILRRYMDSDIPILEWNHIPWGMISLFASYGRGRFILNTDFWEYPIPHFYAGLAVIYSPAFRKEYVSQWDKMMKGEIPMCVHQDDLFCKDILNASGTRLFGIRRDLVQHTGINARTFGDKAEDPGTQYQSAFFVGE
jgi:hypothetical protein